MGVLITGGTGFLGRRTALAFLSRGERVRILGRNPMICEEMRSVGAEVIQADLSDRGSVIAACAGMDAVCHAGALSAPWGRRATFYATNVDGTANVIAGCKAHGVPRLVYISSPSVVFDGRDCVDQREDAPFPRRFASVYSETKRWGEALVARAAADGMETVILRPKAIFGPGDTSLLPRILNAARHRKLPQIGNGQNRLDLTYVDNVVHAISLALASDQAPGRIYTITNGEPVRLWDLIRTILQRLGTPSELRKLPFPVVYAAAALMEGWGAVSGREPLLTRYTVSILARTQTYDITAAHRDLGYRPLVSIAEGVEGTLQWAKEQPN